MFNQYSIYILFHFIDYKDFDINLNEVLFNLIIIYELIKIHFNYILNHLKLFNYHLLLKIIQYFHL